MKEDLITFKTAKLAHEKGYTREVVGYSFTTTRRNYYNDKGELNGDCTGFIKDVIKYGMEKAKVGYVLYPATSQSLLQKWLREEHNVEIEINKLTKYFYKFYKGDLNDYNGDKLPYKTYEQALEKGLQEALKLV